MGRQTLVRLLCVSAAAVIGGCTLDAAREFGESCENPSFIWTSGKIIRQEDGNLDYAVNFRHGLCPVNAQYCMTLKGDNVGDVLASNINYCSDKREACPEDSHLFEGKCERDSALHCGSNEMNCLDREKGVAEAECVKDTYGNKACKATKCLDTFALLNGACKSGGECCGDYCMDCTRIPPQVKCFAESLNSESMTCGENCPTHAPDECNGVCIDPMTNVTFCGSENCELRYCVDIVGGWRNGNCIQGKCKVSDCLVGYHILRNADGNTCEKDTTDVCGDYKIDCNDISEAISVECHLGNCIVQKCEEGYDAYNDECLPSKSTKCGNTTCGLHAVCNADKDTCECEPGYTECNGVCYNLSTDLLHCGSCSNECHIAHAESTCQNHECLFVRCNDGYEYSNTTDRCEFTGRCASGFVYNHNTGRCEASDKGCEQGQIDCNGDGLVCCNCNGACDGDKCDNAVCDPVVRCEDGSGCASSCCIENVCVARSQCGSTIDCGQHAHVYGDGCEPDSVENCGEHGKTCNVPNADNDCIDGACTFKCSDGHHQMNDGCVPNNCTDGQKFCTNKGEIGEVSTCIGGVLGEAVSCETVSCNSENDCGICQNGDRQCADVMPQICADGAWVDEIACSAPENGVAVCSGKGVCGYTCSNGYTDNGRICCKDVNNAAILHDSSETCSFSCNNGYHESGTGCESDACTEGATQCSGRVPQTCSGGVWSGSTECALDKICSNGSCIACASGKHVYENSCEDDSVTNCGTHGNTCAKDNASAECTNGTCSYTCLANYCDVSGSCVNNNASYCYGANSQCGECTAPSNSTAKCTNGSCSYTCKGGYSDNGKICCADVDNATIKYDRQTTCSFECNDGFHEDGDGCASDACSDGAKQCSGRIPQICSGGKWEKNGTCNARTQICEDGDCVTCETEEHVSDNECEPNDNNNCGTHGNKCTTSVWGATSTCNKSAGSCEVKCNNSDYDICTNECVDTDTDTDNCGECGNVCDIAHATSHECYNGTCYPEDCVSGYHVYIDMCEDDNENNCGAHGQKCNSSIIAHGTAFDCETGVCKATACENGFNLTSSGTCEEITCMANNCLVNGECVSNNADHCYSAGCGACNLANATEHSCNSGTCCATGCISGFHVYDCACVQDECSGSETTCSNNSSQIGQVRECSGGVLGTATSCDSVSCNSEGTDCGSCVNGEKRCNERTPQTCVNGALSGNSECPQDKICELGECVSCGSGYHVHDNVCEKDDLSNCGSHGNNCTAPTNGTAVCNNGECMKQCNNSGDEICGNACVNTNSNLNNCGECGHVCEHENVSESRCESGTCQAVSCIDPSLVVYGSYCYLKRYRCVGGNGDYFCSESSILCSNASSNNCFKIDDYYQCGPSFLCNSKDNCSNLAGSASTDACFVLE